MNLEDILHDYQFRPVKGHTITNQGNGVLISVAISSEVADWEFLAEAGARAPFFVTNERIGLTLVMPQNGNPRLRATDPVISELLKRAGCRHFVDHAKRNEVLSR